MLNSKPAITLDEQFITWYDAADKYIENSPHILNFSVRDLIRNAFVAGVQLGTQHTTQGPSTLSEGGDCIPPK